MLTSVALFAWDRIGKHTACACDLDHSHFRPVLFVLLHTSSLIVLLTLTQTAPLYLIHTALSTSIVLVRTVRGYYFHVHTRTDIHRCPKSVSTRLSCFIVSSLWSFPPVDASSTFHALTLPLIDSSQLCSTPGHLVLITLDVIFYASCFSTGM